MQQGKCYRCDQPFSPRIPLIGTDGQEQQWCPLCLLWGCFDAMALAGISGEESMEHARSAWAKTFAVVEIRGTDYTMADLREYTDESVGTTASNISKPGTEER